MAAVTQDHSGLSVTQSSLRELNLATVARVIFAHAPVSRAEVAARTGMTRSTVSRLVDELVSHHLVDELVPQAGLRGRPAVPLVPASSTWLGLGLEVNVGFSAIRLVDLTGRVIADRIVLEEHGESTAEVVLGRLVAAAAKVLSARTGGSRLAGVGLALPGLVDTEAGVLLRAPNLGWSNVPAAEIVSRGLALEVPVRVGNEADFAALHTARQAPGRGSDFTDFLYLSGEVGIGSALVRSGDLVSGRHGWAGEIGHFCVDPQGFPCGCGARGCLETVAGLRALHEAAGVPDRRQLMAAIEAGDPRATQAVEAASHALGIAVSGALNLLDVSQVVLGGHLADLGDSLRKPLLAELDRRVLAAPFAPIRVSLLDLDLSPASVGAAVAVLEDLVRSPAARLSHHPTVGQTETR